MWASLFAGLMFLVAHASYMILSAHRKRSEAETDALEAKHKDLPDEDRTPFVHGPDVPLGHGGVDVHAALHGVPADRRRPVRLGGVALDGGSRADRLDHLSHHSRHVLPGLLVDLDRPEGHPGIQGRDDARAGSRRAGPEVGQVSARQPPLPPGHSRRRPDRVDHRASS